MKLTIAYYSITGDNWVGAEDTSILSYSIVQRMNEPAECTIVLKDPTGAKAQLYKNTATYTYIGPGRVLLEDPTATYIFRGEFIRAEADTDSRTLTIYAQDHLTQLDREQIDYDMREKLGTTDLRESVARSDSTDLLVVSNVAGTYYFYDDGAYDTPGELAFANDQYNGMYLILTDKMAGKKTWTFHPYTGVTTDADNTIDGAIFNVWKLDGLVNACSGVADYTTTYTFRCEVGHDTPSDFYVHDSITALRVIVRYTVGELPQANHVHLIVDGPVAQHTIAHLPERDVFETKTFAMDADDVDDAVQADGTLDLIFSVVHSGGNATVDISYLAVEIDCATTGYSTPVLIDDTFNPNKLEIATDLTAEPTQVWEQIPYCIARPIYKHIASDETPGTLITDGDPIFDLVCTDTIEHTSSISTRQYIKKTRLEILQDLAVQDKAQFWIELGTVVVTWQSTFGADSVQLTDTDVNAWRMTTDSMTVANRFIVQGMRIGDTQLESISSDATSITAYQQTHTRVIKNVGLVSEADTKARADAGVAQYKDVMRMLSVRLDGNTAKAAHAKTLRLGDVVAVTSTYLGLTDVDYVVQQYSYESGADETTLLLHPKVSTTGLQEIQQKGIENIRGAHRRGTVDSYVPEPASEELA